MQMRCFVLSCMLPLLAVAQTYSSAPLMAIENGATPSSSAPQIAETPSSDEVPASSAAPVPQSPATPASPTSPPAPVNSLWPSDTVSIFVTSCSHLHRETMAPCRCIIEGVMNRMGHDEFLRLSDAQRIETDARYLDIRERCVPTQPPQRH